MVMVGEEREEDEQEVVKIVVMVREDEEEVVKVVVWRRSSRKWRR